MARKTRRLNGFVPEPGFEEHWQRHVEAVAALDKAWSDFSKLGDKIDKTGQGSSHKLWPDFLEAGKVYERASRTAFGTLDVYQHAVAHKDDKVNVPQDEVRPIVIDSLSDKVDELEFTINVGLLGSKVAEAIRKDVTEESSDPAYCQDCK